MCVHKVFNVEDLCVSGIKEEMFLAPEADVDEVIEFNVDFGIFLFFWNVV